MGDQGSAGRATPALRGGVGRETEIVPEVNEPAVWLRPMTAGAEVVEDYEAMWG